MKQATVQTIIRTYQQPLAITAKPIVFLTILQRLNRRDSEAVADCIDTYGAKIWAFAKANSSSPEDAEFLTEAIFRDIWTYADQKGDSVATDEQRVIHKIAYRRLIKQVAESAKKLGDYWATTLSEASDSRLS